MYEYEQGFRRLLSIYYWLRLRNRKLRSELAFYLTAILLINTRSSDGCGRLPGAFPVNVSFTNVFHAFD